MNREVPKASKGSGESRSQIQQKRDDRFDRAEKRGKKSSLMVLPTNRAPASECLRYGTHRVRYTRSVAPLRYSCVKERPRWCTWLQTKTITQRCENQKAKYAVEYSQDPSWKPNYQYSDRQKNYRDYNSVLPNKFDLLKGESEELNVFANTGRSQSLNPKLKITSKWNDYQSTVLPSEIRCEFNKPVEFKILVNTLGRKKTKAPNTLALPLDEQGKLISPFEVQNGRPTGLKLIDTGRATQLAAAANSRAFSRPEEAPQAQADAIYKKVPLSSDEIKGLQGGYWQETRFRLQLAENGRWGRVQDVTIPAHFGSNQGQVFGDEFNISLIGKDQVPNLYRAIGPFQSVLGWLWTRTGVEFTPGQTYTFKIQALSRGLPFYESGCQSGAHVCEGEIGSEETYSEPLVINWTAPKNEDHRSLFKKFKDWQKNFQVL